MQWGLNKSCFPPPPQIRSIPKGKLSVNTYKIGRLLMMINIATSRAEMLQNVQNLRAHTRLWKPSQTCSREGAAPPSLGQQLVRRTPLGREHWEAAKASAETTRATDATLLLRFRQGKQILASSRTCLWRSLPGNEFFLITFVEELGFESSSQYVSHINLLNHLDTDSELHMFIPSLLSWKVPFHLLRQLLKSFSKDDW